MNMRVAWSLFAPVRFSFKPFTTDKAAIAFENHNLPLPIILYHNYSSPLPKLPLPLKIINAIIFNEIYPWPVDSKVDSRKLSVKVFTNCEQEFDSTDSPGSLLDGRSWRSIVPVLLFTPSHFPWTFLAGENLTQLAHLAGCWMVVGGR